MFAQINTTANIQGIARLVHLADCEAQVIVIS
jgi:hypothetical protein